LCEPGRRPVPEAVRAVPVARRPARFGAFFVRLVGAVAWSRT
jgi:hypothetical protein